MSETGISEAGVASVSALVRVNGRMIGEREVRGIDGALGMDGDIFRCEIVGEVAIGIGDKVQVEFKDSDDFFASGRAMAFWEGRLELDCDFYSGWFDTHWDYKRDEERKELLR